MKSAGLVSIALGHGRALDEIVMRGFWRHYRSLMTDDTAAA